MRTRLGSELERVPDVVNEDESAEGRFRLAESHSGDGDHLPQAANFKAEHLLLSE